LAEARDDQRERHLNVIWNAIEQKIYQEGGKWDCTEVPAFPEDPLVVGTGEGECNLYPCLYPDFINDPGSLIDPQTGSFDTIEDYSTGYQICQDSQDEKISFRVAGETRHISVGPFDWPVTCDNLTAHFSSGCALLLEYDADDNGEISTLELLKASDDALDGYITENERDFVGKVWEEEEGVINNLCSGCY